MLVGDFNAEESESYILKFLYEYYTKNIAKNYWPYDICIANSALLPKNTTDLNFHKIVITAIKMIFKKHSTIERHYGHSKYFYQTEFKKDCK